MDYWRQHRRASRIARAILVVWCFALASSWANACLLQDRASLHEAAHRHTTSLTASRGDEPPASLIDDHAASGHDRSDGPRELCQSVCDDEQATLPKVVTPSMPDLGPPGLVPAEPWSFCAAQAQFPSGCPLAAAPPPEPPVAIRFLRLMI